MIEKLQAEILKAQDNLQTIDFKLNDEKFTFCYRYLTLLQKVRIEQMCVKPFTTIGTDGETTVEQKKQDHMIPIHTILECALDEDGKKLFSHTNPEHVKLITSFPAGLASYIAYEMSLDIFGSMKPSKDE